MFAPPFKRNLGGLDVTGSSVASQPPVGCCEQHSLDVDACVSSTRAKLHEMDTPLHCSIVGNCLSTAELRKLMAKHIAVKDLSDLEIHHTAVVMAGQIGEVSKALHKALDQRHAGAVRTFSTAKDETALTQRWRDAWAQGEIPGAYWAVLTHKKTTADLRQMVFGEVHMLSHLMAASNRHELQRFVMLEKENADLRERLDREQQRRLQLVQERDQIAEQMRQQLVRLENSVAQYRTQLSDRCAPPEANQLVVLQTQRRERAEQLAHAAQEQLLLLQEQLAHLQKHGQYLAEELAAAEAELHHLSEVQSGVVAAVHPSCENSATLQAQRVLYVGGRPSSTPSIRDYVCRRGGEFLHHDGGLEDRKGLLDSLLPRASLVVFPVDCVDHDSVTKLKRLSERHQVPFVPLRSASLACFAATLKRELANDVKTAAFLPQLCLRHS
ncbi:DUF2325 domain-containing protein [Comamonas aquatilis]|uniref:DUF2325 domain-containing protein n=1 Tax=Comamonas aquatilis TaxID=1778406 RepID=UPI0039EFAC3E